MKEEPYGSSFCYTLIMKRKIIEIFISMTIIIIYVMISNHNLYNNYNLKKRISLNRNEEKRITIKNKSNNKYIYNFYLDKDAEKVFVNNREISMSYIKDNNYIIYKVILDKKEQKRITFRINKDNSKIEIERIKYNIKLINHIKGKSSNKSYFIDTDSAKELYRFKHRYKYIGNVSNNYIYFNCKDSRTLTCELYRIIGIDSKGYIKIIKNSYENIKLNNYNIYDRNKYLLKSSNIEILTIDDYIDSYRKVNSKCVKNIYSCKSKSYLTPINNELVNSNGKLLTITSNGNVIKRKITSFYRPVLYLKKDVKVLSGDGSSRRPYVIK